MTSWLAGGPADYALSYSLSDFAPWSSVFINANRRRNIHPVFDQKVFLLSWLCRTLACQSALSVRSSQYTAEKQDTIDLRQESFVTFIVCAHNAIVLSLSQFLRSFMIDQDLQRAMSVVEILFFHQHRPQRLSLMIVNCFFMLLFVQIQGGQCLFLVLSKTTLSINIQRLHEMERITQVCQLLRDY